MNVDAERVVLELFRIGAIRIDTKNGFETKHSRHDPHAPRSPVFVDLSGKENPNSGRRRGLSQIIIDQIGRVLWSVGKTRTLPFDTVAGLPHNGIPLANAFVQAAYMEGRTLPSVILAKSCLGLGTIQSIADNGGIEPNIDGRQARVLLVDDVISQGSSKLEALEILLKAGYDVANILVFCDREQGGESKMCARGVALVSACTLADILKLGRQHGFISKNELRAVEEYLKQ